MKRLTALLLILIICVTTLAACGGDDEPAAVTTDAPETSGSVTTKPIDEGPGYDDVVKKDWDGYTFKILYGTVGEGEHQTDFICENLNGNVLNDQVYIRNTTVETDCNINLDPFFDPNVSISTTIQTQDQAGWTEGDYDMFGHAGRTLIPLAGKGYLADLGAYDEINIYNDYWDQGFVDQFVIEDSIYALSGEFSVVMQLGAQVMCFNKSLFSENGFDDPYALVRNKEWTVDVMLDYMDGFGQDYNNDGYDWSSDLFALSGWGAEAGYGVFYGSGFTFAKNDGDTISLDFDRDYLDDLTDVLIDVWSGNGTYINFSGKIEEHHMPHDIFSSGRGLFCDIATGKISAFFTEMEDDYGILPEPMLNKDQGRYYSYVSASGPVLAVGKHDQNPERTGNIIEAICAASSDIVMPKMFEIVTKIQNARDEDSAEMLDIAFSSKIFDAAHWLKLDCAYYYPQHIIKEGQNIMASYLKMYESKSRTYLENYVEAIKSFKE